MAASNPADPRVSVIIPCRGHAQALRRCLDSVTSQAASGSFEVIVVDSEADASVASAVAAFPSVRLVRSHEGLRPGPARNLGVRHARGAILLFIDADCSCEPGWIETATASLDGGARGVGGPVLHGQPWHPVAVTDNFMQFADLPVNRPRGPARLLPSCNLAIGRADFDAIGGFPSFTAGEDVLFCLAVAERWGKPLLFEPGMRVRHFGRTRLADFWRHQELFGRMRGALGIELTPAQRKLGRFAVAAPAVATKRLAFLFGRARAAGPATMARVLLLLPWLTFGLIAWCAGFRRGCRQPLVSPQSMAAG